VRNRFSQVVTLTMDYKLHLKIYELILIYNFQKVIKKIITEIYHDQRVVFWDILFSNKTETFFKRKKNEEDIKISNQS